MTNQEDTEATINNAPAILKVNVSFKQITTTEGV